MKGVIFNAFEAFITENWGSEFYEDLLGACELVTTEPFVGPGTYPDEDLLALVGEAVERLQLPVDEVLQAFGRFAFGKLIEAYPRYAEGHSHPCSLISNVHDVIHVEVKKLFPEAQTPEVRARQTSRDEMIVTYRSSRGLAPLFVGLIDGASGHFGVPIGCEPLGDCHFGIKECDFRLTFASR